MKTPQLRLRVISILCLVSLLAADARLAFANNENLEDCIQLTASPPRTRSADGEFFGGFLSRLADTASGIRRRISIGAPDATAVNALLLNSPISNSAKISEESKETRALRSLLKDGHKPVLSHFRTSLHPPGFLGKRPVAFNQMAADELFPVVIRQLENLNIAMEVRVHQSIIEFETRTLPEQRALIARMIESLRTSGEPNEAPPGKVWFVNALKLEWMRFTSETSLLTFVSSLVSRYSRDNDEVSASAAAAVSRSLESLSDSARAAERARARGREAWWATKRTKILLFGATVFFIWHIFHPKDVVQPEKAWQHPAHASENHAWAKISPDFERWLKAFDAENARVGNASTVSWPNTSAAALFLDETVKNYQTLGQSLRKTLPVDSHVTPESAVRVTQFSADTWQTLFIGASTQYATARNEGDAMAIEVARNRYWDVLSGRLIDAAFSGQTAAADTVLTQLKEDLRSPADSYRFINRFHANLLEMRLLAQEFAKSMGNSADPSPPPAASGAK